MRYKQQIVNMGGAAARRHGLIPISFASALLVSIQTGIFRLEAVRVLHGGQLQHLLCVNQVCNVVDRVRSLCSIHGLHCHIQPRQKNLFSPSCRVAVCQSPLGPSVGACGQSATVRPWQRGRLRRGVAELCVYLATFPSLISPVSSGWSGVHDYVFWYTPFQVRNGFAALCTAMTGVIASTSAASLSRQNMQTNIVSLGAASRLTACCPSCLADTRRRHWNVTVRNVSVRHGRHYRSCLGDACSGEAIPLPKLTRMSKSARAQYMDGLDVVVSTRMCIPIVAAGEDGDAQNVVLIEKPSH